MGAEGSDKFEKIEVIGERPLNFYFEMRDKKRTEFMKEFNDLVQKEDFKFVCKRRNRRSSHIKHEVCKNQYEWRIYQEIMQDEIERGNVLGASAVAAMGNQEQRKLKVKLVKKIQLLLEENQDLNKTYIEFKAADKAYQKAHLKKFGIFSPYSSQ